MKSAALRHYIATACRHNFPVVFGLKASLLQATSPRPLSTVGLVPGGADCRHLRVKGDPMKTWKSKFFAIGSIALLFATVASAATDAAPAIAAGSPARASAVYPAPLLRVGYYGHRHGYHGHGYGHYHRPYRHYYGYRPYYRRHYHGGYYHGHHHGHRYYYGSYWPYGNGCYNGW